MDTILLLLAVVVLTMAYLLVRGPRLEDPDDPWDAAPTAHRARRIPSSEAAPKGRHGDRRYHDVDCPIHRRRTDGVGGES
ncbi:MAG TPA: hypothetical protein VK842_07875 [bacterium]|nr:hypothetical protein [bacterium]